MKNSECLSATLFILKYTGVWCPCSLSDRGKKLYLVFAFFFQFISFILIVLAEIGYLVRVLDDTELAVDAVVLLLSHLVQGVKVLTIWCRQSRIRRLIEIIDGPNFTKTDPAKIAILNSTTILYSFISKAFISSAGVTAIFWSLVPTLRTELTLPLRTAYPFDFSGWPIFGIMYAYTTVSLIMVGVSDAAENYLVAALMILVGAQLDVLRCELEEAGSGKAANEYENVISSIKYHQHIIEYVKELASIFGLAIFCQFVSSSTILCMTVFKITTTSEPIEKTTMIFYLICIILELFSYSYPGNLLINKSLLISEAAYPDNWSGDIRVRKALLLTSLRAQRPLQINAGGVFRVCLPTAAAVVQTSYSYYAVLRQKVM